MWASLGKGKNCLRTSAGWTLKCRKPCFTALEGRGLVSPHSPTAPAGSTHTIDSVLCELLLRGQGWDWSGKQPGPGRCLAQHHYSGSAPPFHLHSGDQLLSSGSSPASTLGFFGPLHIRGADIREISRPSLHLGHGLFLG